jgi:hypothetical protein
MAMPAAAVVAASLALTGCQLEKMFPEKVANGVARLSVRNTANLVGLVAGDTNCGFGSDMVKSQAQFEGAVGDQGRMILTIERCDLSFGDETVVSTDCYGNETRASGNVSVSGTLTVDGLLTGDPETPVIPNGAQAINIELAADLDNFMITQSNADTSIKQIRGKLSVKAKPPVAQSASTGFCAVTTSNVTLTDITYENALVFVNSGDSAFEVDVPKATFSAQIGEWQGQENTFSGNVQVWETDVQVPADQEEDVPDLDPEYDAETFQGGYACKEDLATPISYTCDTFPSAPVAQGTAQLTTSLFGNLTTIIDLDESCGFSSPGVLSQPQLAGEIGHRGGSLTFNVNNCTIDFPPGTVAGENCQGKKTFIEGRVTFSGTKILTGILTGDLTTPIVPDSDHPAAVSYTADLSNLKISDTDGVNALTVVSGQMGGLIAPKTGIDTTLGACSIKLPIVRIENLTLDQAQLKLEAGPKTFVYEVAHAQLNAQSGNDNGRENYLAGNVMVNGEELPIPVDGGEPILDPTYNPDTFDSSYSCKENLYIQQDPSECSFTKVLAAGAARLIIQNAGSIASMVNGNEDCGFEATTVLLDPVDVQGEAGEMGSMKWETQCTVGGSLNAPASTDCNGDHTYIGGSATVSAARTVVGEREKKFFIIDSIIPRDPRAVTIDLNNVNLDGFSAYGAPANGDPAGILTLHSGVMNGTVKPITGERASEPGIYDVATPIANIPNVTVQNADVTLWSEGKTFHFTINNASLSAFNGAYDGFANFLSGTITIDGEQVNLGEIPLNPDYSQAKFNSSYQCTEDLAGIMQ